MGAQFMLKSGLFDRFRGEGEFIRIHVEDPHRYNTVVFFEHVHLRAARGSV